MENQPLITRSEKRKNLTGGSLLTVFKTSSRYLVKSMQNQTKSTNRAYKLTVGLCHHLFPHPLKGEVITTKN